VLITVCYFLQIIATDVSIELDMWYNVTFRGLGLGHANYILEINGDRVATVDEAFTQFNLSTLNGILYIGGHPNPMEIVVSSYS